MDVTRYHNVRCIDDKKIAIVSNRPVVGSVQVYNSASWCGSICIVQISKSIGLDHRDSS